MLLSSTKTQIVIMQKMTKYKFAFLITLAYACFSFCYILTEFSGVDISIIKDANQAVCYSQLNRLWFFFSIIYPFLIVLPFSTSYIDDYRNQLLPVYISRSSRKDYYVSKLIAAFVGTAVIIAVPFLLNLILCNVFLPHNYNTWFAEYQMGDYYRGLLGTNLLYHTAYHELPFLKVYLFSPLFYNIMYLLFFSLFSGLLGSFVLSLSFWARKSKIMLFVPTFIIIQLMQVYDAWTRSGAIDSGKTYTNTNILEYVIPSLIKGRSPLFILAIIGLFTAILVCSTAYAVREDIRSLQ